MGGSGPQVPGSCSRVRMRRVRRVRSVYSESAKCGRPGSRRRGPPVRLVPWVTSLAACRGCGRAGPPARSVCPVEQSRGTARLAELGGWVGAGLGLTRVSSLLPLRRPGPARSLTPLGKTGVPRRPKVPGGQHWPRVGTRRPLEPGSLWVVSSPDPCRSSPRRCTCLPGPRCCPTPTSPGLSVLALPSGCSASTTFVGRVVRTPAVLLPRLPSEEWG